MSDWQFDKDAARIVTSIEEQLHDRGWASHVTLPALLETWENLAATVNRYDGVIEEHLDDVTNRDALDVVLKELAPDPLIGGLQERVERADESFRQHTQDDNAQELRRFFRITDDDDWWWHRIPTSGPLLEEIRPS